MRQLTCPTCKYQGADLVRIWSCALNQMQCQKCVDQQAIGDTAMDAIDKLAAHQQAGTLNEDTYPVAKRIEDMYGPQPKPETIQ
jgi:hypothetical protein